LKHILSLQNFTDTKNDIEKKIQNVKRTTELDLKMSQMKTLVFGFKWGEER